MGEGEHTKMIEAGQVQLSSGNPATHVIYPSNPDTFIPPPQSTKFVEFDVPNLNFRSHDASQGLGRIFNSESIDARLLKMQGKPYPTTIEMPKVQNINIKVNKN